MKNNKQDQQTSSDMRSVPDPPAALMTWSADRKTIISES